MPTHLPPDEMLAEFACGATSPGVSLLIATHLTQAPESRGKVEEFERIGGILLADEEPKDMPSGALDATLSMIGDAPESLPSRKADVAPCPLPRTVLDRLGVDFDDIPWKFQLPGVSAVDVDGFEGEKVRLLRAKPGSSVPQHTHEGTELTLVMHGCLEDDGIAYSKGDVAVNDEDDDHRPRILGDEICYCLIVQQGDLKFTGTFSRVLNYLGE